jgi:hypothetical protein
LLPTLIATNQPRVEDRPLTKENGVSSAKVTMLLVVSLDEIGESGSATSTYEGYMKDRVCHLPMSKSFRQRISQAITNVCDSQLRSARDELEYSLDVYRINQWSIHPASIDILLEFPCCFQVISCC